MDETERGTRSDEARLFTWVHEVTNGAPGDPGAYRLERLDGGNSNDTALATAGDHRWVVRRPPAQSIAPDANNLDREHRVLTALDGAAVRVPRVLAPIPTGPWREELGPVLLMEWIDGVSITEELPVGHGHGDLRAIGHELVDAIAELHAVDWRRAGLEGFGRPEGYLTRQVGRLRDRFDRHQVRELPLARHLAERLARTLPPEQPAALVHGDYHLDNTLVRADRPELAAIIDFELSTIGDPLVDLGMLLAFWGDDRPTPPAMPRIQGVTRTRSAPGRTELVDRYERLTGRAVDRIEWYVAFALWRLASIVEGAYAQHVRGETDTEYARDLELDVPRLLDEAALAIDRDEAT